MELHQAHKQHHDERHVTGSSSSGGGGGGSGTHDSIDSRPTLSQTDVQTTTASLSTQQQRVCLETSFTNLHSPLMTHKHHTHFSESISSSKDSSLAGSVLSRSQISCIQYDISSVMESGINSTATSATGPRNNNNNKSPILTTPEELQAVMKMNEHVELILAPPPPLKTKCVAFEDTPSPLRNLRRQHSAKIENKPKSLPIPPLRRASDITSSVDAIQDEWLGLAPLASPETLSEISSISSRNSIRNGLGTSIEHYLHNMSKDVDINEIFESQLHTPTVLRRAPKFIENLSSCAEDSRNVDQYKRMGRVIVPPPLFIPHIQDSSEDEDSFESANSYKKVSTNIGRPKIKNTTTKVSTTSGHRRQNSKSADQLDDVISATNKQQTEAKTRKLTFSDSNILNDNESNGESELTNLTCTKCNSTYCTCQINTSNTGSQDTTFYSANSSIDCITKITNTTATTAVTKSYSNQHIIPEGVLESHFPLHHDAFTTTTELFSKNYSTLNEDHSVLVQMSKGSFMNSPPTTTAMTTATMGRGKRKNCIYPSALSSQPLYMVNDNVKLFTNNNTTTNLPELNMTNGSSPSPRSQTPNESSV